LKQAPKGNGQKAASEVNRIFHAEKGVPVSRTPYKPDFPAFFTGFSGVESAVLSCMEIQI
jgi:hypothetical protein